MIQALAATRLLISYLPLSNREQPPQVRVQDMERMHWTVAYTITADVACAWLMLARAD